jgi:YebC/PmpR family DNA-binding regulatory protein
MPKENIERAIKRATAKEAGDFEEVTYEGFAPGGKISLIIEAATDNSLRTTSLVKSIFSKAGAHFGQPGSVAYQFNQVGQIIVKKGAKSYDEIFEVAAEVGADEIEEAGDEIFIYTTVSGMKTVREVLVEKGIEIVDSETTRIPASYVQISDETEKARVEKFIESIEELDDVQKIYSNLEL